MSVAVHRRAFAVAANRRQAPVPLPSPMRTNFINRTPGTSQLTDSARSCFRHMLAVTDIGLREMSFQAVAYRPDTLFNGADPKESRTAAQINKALLARMTAQTSQAGAAKVSTADDDLHQESVTRSFGDRTEETSARWRPKHYGNVTFGPRNYPYPISRWLGRRFQMKKHKILKRMRFRRYKLAAVANLPHAKMIRVGMLPELKSSKSKKGDDVDASLSSQLVSAAKGASGAKVAGRRSRPKSKYQV